MVTSDFSNKFESVKAMYMLSNIGEMVDKINRKSHPTRSTHHQCERKHTTTHPVASS